MAHKRLRLVEMSASGVWGNETVRSSEKRMAVRKWFGIGNVEPCRAELAGTEPIRQCNLVNRGTASDCRRHASLQLGETLP